MVYLVNATKYNICDGDLPSGICLSKLEEISSLINREEYVVVLLDGEPFDFLFEEYEKGFVISENTIKEEIKWKKISIEQTIFENWIRFLLPILYHMIGIKNQNIPTDIYNYNSYMLLQHELHTPVNIVLGLSRLGISNMDGEKAKDYFKKIYTAADMLGRLIKVLFQYQEVSFGTIKSNVEYKNIRDVSSGAMNLFSYDAEQKNVHLILQVEDSVEKYLMQDFEILELILYQLLHNAVKFTEKGFVTLKISCLKEEEHFQILRFSVEDTGVGISKDKMKEIMEPYCQLDEIYTRNHGGVGLGLPFVEKLLKHQGSTLQIDSRLDEGSTFYFDLDFNKKDMESKEEVETYEFENIQIVYIDEDPVQRESFIKICGSMGIDVLLAEYGAKLDRITNEVIHGFFLNIGPFEKNPQGFIKKIKKQFPNIPLVVMTNCPEKKFKKMDSGMDFFLLPKRPSVEEMAKLVSQFLNPNQYQIKKTSRLEDLSIGNGEAEVKKVIHRFSGKWKLMEEVVSKTIEVSKNGGDKLIKLYRKNLKDALIYAESLLNLAEYLGILELQNLIEEIHRKMTQGSEIEKECLLLNQEIEKIIQYFVDADIYHMPTLPQNYKSKELVVKTMKDMLIHLEEGHIQEIEISYQQLKNLLELGESTWIDQLGKTIKLYQYEKAKDALISRLEGILC